MNFSNKNSDGRKKLQEKGYYIVLFLCVLAVGISGYIFVSTAVRQNREEQLSVPNVVDKLPDDKENSSPTGAVVDDDPATAMTQEEKDAALRQQVKESAVTPLEGEVIREFSLESLSYNETTRDWRLHAAVDIAAEDGQVGACMAGTVTEVFDDALLGKTVVLCHDGGYETRYSGLAEELKVQVGDMVEAGDAIGLVGDTAILESGSPAHLHFQVLLDGEPVDPAEFLD